MRRIAAWLYLALACVTSSAAQNPRPIGLNCKLSAPPASAGEESNHGTTLRIFPRARDINSKYSGCQVLFAEQKEHWVVVSVTEVVKGDAIRVWSEDHPDEDTLSCRYSRGKVIRGNPDTCPMPEFILIKSLAPGCVKRMQEAVAKHGLGASSPEGCKYE